jgi:signal transduction histidine kinase
VLYELLFRRLPLPVALVDHDLIVHDANEAYTRLAGVESAELVGVPLAITFPSVDAADAARSAASGGSAFEEAGMLGSHRVTVRIASLDGADDRALVFVTAGSEGDGDDPRLGELYSAIRAIKHEINNPLTGALGNINLLLRRSDLDEKTRRRLATAEQEIKKVSQIVLRLSELAPTTHVNSTPT